MHEIKVSRKFLKSNCKILNTASPKSHLMYFIRKRQSAPKPNTLYLLQNVLVEPVCTSIIDRESWVARLLHGPLGHLPECNLSTAWGDHTYPPVHLPSLPQLFFPFQRRLSLRIVTSLHCPVT